MRQERAAVESAAEVFEDGQAVFADRGDVAADASVATSTVEGAKATGDLDADLHHAESTFGFVVGKGQFQCPQECKDSLFVALQTIQQALRFGLFAALHGPLLRREGIGLAARAQEAAVLLLPAAILPLGRGRIPGFEGANGLEHLQEEIVQIIGPRLVVLLEEEDQFAQQVAFTERVLAVLETQIAGEKVMHEPTGELGEDADVLHGLLTAFEMDGEEGQQWRA